MPPLDPTKFLELPEVLAVLADLHKRRRYRSSRQNLAIFRLACCCGLRRCEISGLQLRDLVLSVAKPAVRVRAETTKGHSGKRHPRTVPLWWDAGTLEDLRAWLAERKSQGAGPGDPVVCSQVTHSLGRRLRGNQLARKWRSAIRCLGVERVRQVSIHGGRHTFCSLALAAGRSLVEVQHAAGHRNPATTGVYLHLVERQGVPDVFAVKPACSAPASP